MEHAGLDAIGAEVVENDTHLLGNKINGNVVDSDNALGVLRRQRCQCRHRVAAQRCHRLDVGLNASASAGIGSGDDQHAALHVPGSDRLTGGLFDDAGDVADDSGDQLCIFALGHDTD